MLGMGFSGKYKTCLLECLSCVELWGNIYDGSACANGCALTDGSSIDANCEHGVYVRKRFEKIQAEDKCKKQCKYCAMELSKIHYSESKCLRTCAEGAGVDAYCSKHLTWYSMVN